MVKIFEVSVDDLLYKDLQHLPRFNTVLPPPADAAAAVPAELKPGEIEDPEVPYTTGDKEEMAFWVIMEQIREIRKEIEYIKELIMQRRTTDGNHQPDA
jgi:hypothetical protein